jgi:hypothetical protein
MRIVSHNILSFKAVWMTDSNNSGGRPPDAIFFDAVSGLAERTFPHTDYETIKLTILFCLQHEEGETLEAAATFMLKTVECPLPGRLRWAFSSCCSKYARTKT